MEQIAEPVIDKSTWGDGPWQHEPDREEWTHAGLPCLALRSLHGGNWCGYVAVPSSHPLYRVPYNTGSDALLTAIEALKGRTVGEVEMTMARTLQALCGDLKPTPEVALDVHGGLTYSDACSGRICHVPAPGEPDDVWWFGFDCAHAYDLSPGMRARMEAIMPPELKPSVIDRDEVYRDLGYVRGEVNKLAEQLAALKKD